MDTDARLLQLLEQDPEAGLAALMERYGGAVRAAAARRLSDEEDVRECVNDVFAQFYFQRARFNAGKGSLKNWLCTLAVRRAADRRRAALRRQADPLPEALPAAAAPDPDERLDVQRALAGLPEEEADLLRMRGAGLTVAEIARALDLPYETVKKRQQRSLAKLRKLLLTGLVLALVALLAACGYLLLRYFGVLPGYGVNTRADAPFHTLAAPAEGADQMAALRIEDALWWQDGLVLDVRLQKGPGAADRVVTLPDGSEYTILWQTDLTGNMTLSWDGQEEIYGMVVTDAARSTEDCLVMELVFTGLPAPERGSESVEAVLNCGELEIPFTLVCAGETPPEEYAYALGELGGVLAIPSRSEGGAAVELYPLNSETFSVEPWMTRGAFLDPDPGDVTLTGADGRVWEGTAAGFNPYGTSLYSRWEFGDLPPGDYTLSVPYLLVSAPLPEEFVLPLPDGDGLVLEAPGGSLTAHVSGQPGHLVTAEQEPGAEAFYITFDAAPRRADLTLAGVWLETEMDGMPAPTANGLLTSSGTLPDESGTWAGLEVQLSPDVLEQGCRLAPGVRGKITWKWAWPVELTLRVP